MHVRLERTGSNRTEEFSNGDSRRRLVQTNQLTAELIQPHGCFQTEGDGDSCLTVCSPEHDGVTLPFCYICAHCNEVAEFFAQQHDAVSQLQTNRRVDNVVGRSTQVDAPTSFTGSLRHRFCQRHDIVTSFSLDFTDPFFGDIVRVGDGSNGVVVLFGYTTELPVGPNQCSLNLELPFMATEF